MTRMDAFRQLENHAWLGRIFRKLSAEEIAFCERYITVHTGVTVDYFEAAVQRMFLDKKKPKNWTIIMELLTCANSTAHASEPENKFDDEVNREPWREDK